ncbi:MAG: hypothetical protein LH481_01350 [Burkholderiales bacterium]|nr:hypothetical protein [Burkholderiales bacterium]
MIFSRAGLNALKFAYLVLFAGLGVAAFIVAGSYLYWQSERKNDQQSQRAMQDLRGRLNTAVRDREDLRGSEDTYKSLIARGMFLPEERFDLIEALAALKSRHQLGALTYEVAPQRPLRLAAAAPYSGVNLFASRIKLKVRALHDGDLIAFLDEFPRLQRGFFPIDQCVIKRSLAAATATPASALAPDNEPATVSTAATQPGTAQRPRPATTATPVAALEAECSLNWITLQTKGGSSATASAAPALPNARPQ